MAYYYKNIKQYVRKTWSGFRLPWLEIQDSTDLPFYTISDNGQVIGSPDGIFFISNQPDWAYQQSLNVGYPALYKYNATHMEVPLARPGYLYGLDEDSIFTVVKGGDVTELYQPYTEYNEPLSQYSDEVLWEYHELKMVKSRGRSVTGSLTMYHTTFTLYFVTPQGDVAAGGFQVFPPNYEARERYPKRTKPYVLLKSSIDYNVLRLGSVENFGIGIFEFSYKINENSNLQKVNFLALISDNYIDYGYTSVSSSNFQWGRSPCTLQGNTEMFSYDTKGRDNYNLLAQYLEDYIMPELTFYNFNKKLNSTALPSNGVTITGSFKQPFDILTPSFILERRTTLPYNYMSWYDSDTGLTRYYWIKGKVGYRNKSIQISCEIDVLATYKASILAYDAFVIRSEDQFDPLISDSLYVTKNGVDFQKITPTGTGLTSVNGFYVVAIASGLDPSTTPLQKQGVIKEVGGIKYYATNSAGMTELIDWLTNTGSTGTWADYNPLSRILSIKYFPIDESSNWVTGDSAGSAVFGHLTGGGGYDSFFWNHGGGYFNFTGSQVGTILSATIPDHPQYNNNRKYLNYGPFTEMELLAGPFGEIKLDPNNIDKNNSRQLDFHVDVDLITGLSRLRVYSDSDIIYQSEDYSCVVDIPLTQELVRKYSDILAMQTAYSKSEIAANAAGITGGAAVVIGAAAGNPFAIAGGIGGLSSMLATMESAKKQRALDSYNLNVPKFYTKSNLGAFMKISEVWRLNVKYYLISGDAAEVVGRPTYDKKSLSTCHGATVCDCASVSNQYATLTELKQINEFLNNGFFIE